MESKPKKRQVRKVPSVPTPEPPASPKPDKKSAEQLIAYNGKLVEDLYYSAVYIEILWPLISEGIASVSGRMTNGRFHRGSFTNPNEKQSLELLKGYQMALEDLHNRLHDFVVEAKKLERLRKEKSEDSKAELYNPFMESEDHG